MYELVNVQPFLNFEFKLNEGERFVFKLLLIEFMNNFIRKFFKTL